MVSSGKAEEGGKRFRRVSPDSEEEGVQLVGDSFCQCSLGTSWEKYIFILVLTPNLLNLWGLGICFLNKKSFSGLFDNLLLETIVKSFSRRKNLRF